MIHYRPPEYPMYCPSQHQWLAEKWDRQQKIPENAERQAYDSERRVLMFTVGDEQKELPVTTPPLWLGRTF